MAKTQAELEAIHLARHAAKHGSSAPITDPGLHRDPDHHLDPDDDDDIENHITDSANLSDEDREVYENEIAQLRQQLAASQGRVAPEQRRADEFRQYYETERQARERETRERDAEIEALRQQLEDAAAQAPIEDLLSPEERELFDPAQLAAVAKIADGIAKRRAPKTNVRAEALAVLQEHSAQRVIDYRNDVLTDPTRGVSALRTLADDPAFQEWLALEENDDFDFQVNSLLQARSEKEVDQRAKAVARRIAKFKEQGKARQPAASRPTDARTSLNAGMQRRPQRVTDVEMNKKLAEAKRLSRSRSPADQAKAKAILDSIT